MRQQCLMAAAIALTAIGVPLTPVISNATQPAQEVSIANAVIASAASAKSLKNFDSTALSTHNSYRSTHNVPAMTQDNALAARARAWSANMARSGTLQHSPSSARDGAGENLFVSYTTGSADPASVARQAVKSWYDEVSDYNYSNPGFSSNTGHFTQVVWKSSTRLGCGIAEGSKNLSGNTYKAYYVTCHYAPAGNVMGQFPTNVLKP